MKELEECLEALLAEVKPMKKQNMLALTDACDRILGEDIHAGADDDSSLSEVCHGRLCRTGGGHVGCGQRTSVYVADRGRIICRRFVQRFLIKRDAQYG